ncbi:kinase-like domain-containing protein [Cryomyces antarcticus]|uniref:Aminoglycoside phosphotransferase domain-containing protein n=1 Tax=Cryomyces antarcticus TaxID=329879 RepID=A0ABR0LNS9_9PEZI|nr:hypothetical protein LTR16_003464 [Cryomyces antarcticus]
MGIVTDSDITSYLATLNIIPTTLSQLNGGTANLAWRIRDSTNRSIIIKHAEPYIRTNASILLPTDRMDFEHVALTTLTLPPQPHIDIPIALPSVYHYNSTRHVLLMSDGGPRTMKAAYTDPTLDIPALGRGLGTWLASLHASTKTTTSVGDNQTAKSIARYSYANLASALASYGFDASLGEDIDAEYGSLLQSDDACICHGDFWPGNIVLAAASTSRPTATVVDWELVRRGCGATDVGQFAAEAYLLDRFCGSRGLCAAFLDAYALAAEEKGALGREWWGRCGVHLGTHLAFWPTSVVWGGREETGECVGLGRELLLRARGGGRGWRELLVLPIKPAG